jgi:hypothetical protein
MKSLPLDHFLTPYIQSLLTSCQSFKLNMICPSKLHFESVGWIGFFFQMFKWFQSLRNNLISRKRKHVFHLQWHHPMWIYLASMIWRGCVRGRKINPPFPTVPTSLFICNLYMNPTTFNYPFFLLLPPFGFRKHSYTFAYFISPLSPIWGFFFPLVVSC